MQNKANAWSARNVAKLTSYKRSTWYRVETERRVYSMNYSLFSPYVERIEAFQPVWSPTFLAFISYVYICKKTPCFIWHLCIFHLCYLEIYLFISFLSSCLHSPLEAELSDGFPRKLFSRCDTRNVRNLDNKYDITIPNNSLKTASFDEFRKRKILFIRFVLRHFKLCLVIWC